ncbi:hypothetical protein BASA50_009043 [Batrachochytrium salamandrivorans]|uniref:Uncharacterized protein n=1 Tax=Batrachochytrium salamandrivorans TaxID=1357716 RepID=A0ABQ8F3R7_9FUNG|nr:hypothetical protein BASA62_004361 [Batrachochytrium salamandrivorans]KAH6575864.1 hypothetical protein BASA60_004803 [Batrachochytrium salamandrivorans]KAH6578478.1 hypothetical protein BASA61_000236 [Batrachochytrium salamandrivorans]KAH6591042.1 hypothetical protein BASA50_009043 [Batrachochytrium salamandrivorans]KAH9254298.1 hypothetical protein BASA81_007688 [Batrachochytrium salamandrivorans]
MGAHYSKPTAASSTFVLQNPAVSSIDIPIQFSPNLLRRLQGVNDTQLHSSAEAGYSEADLDLIVQDRVSLELSVHQQNRLIQEHRSVDQVRREAEDLIRRQKEIPKFVPIEEYSRAEQEVTKCYLNNLTRPLDCWQQVQAFKNLEKKALRDFVVLSH